MLKSSSSFVLNSPDSNNHNSWREDFGEAAGFGRRRFQRLQVVFAEKKLHPSRLPVHTMEQTGEGRHEACGGSDGADLQPTGCGGDQDAFQENKQE